MTDTVPATSSTTRAQGMLCPVCRVDLMLSDRQGIEIDYCPQCRGVWLDRGELDKIIERNASFESDAKSRPSDNAGPGVSPGPGYAQPAPWGAGYGGDRHGGGHGGGHGDGHGGGYQRGGFLGGLFRH